jgi:7-cyano-7-deazaguanine synthase
MSTPPKKVVVLHSGGMDSTVCLLLAQEQGCEVISLGIDYGQRHKIELEYATRQCERFGIERRVCLARWDKPTSRSIPTNRTIDEMPKGISPAFLPGRNIVLLALAVAEAAGIGATEVWLGVNSVQFSGYPDCRPEFIDAFRAMVREGFPAGPEVVAPLQHKSKSEIAREAARFGLGKDDTWSCYAPRNVESGVQPCGVCDACILHEAAWHSPKQRQSSGAGGCAFASRERDTV